MRSTVSRLVCWNSRAADAATVTHRNELQVRGNLLVEISHTLLHARGMLLKSIVALEWPDDAWQTSRTADGGGSRTGDHVRPFRSQRSPNRSARPAGAGGAQVVSLTDWSAARACQDGPHATAAAQPAPAGKA